MTVDQGDHGPQVDVVVVAYNSTEMIERCLAPLVDRPVVASITVVDHGTDGSGVRAEHLGATVLEDPTNPGFGAGQNRGASHGVAPFLLLLNPDAVIDAAALSDELGAFCSPESDDLAAVQGAVLDAITGHPDRSSGVELGWVHLLGRATHARALLGSQIVRRLLSHTPLDDVAQRIPDEAHDVDFLAGTAVLIRRVAFESVGGWDERYFLYGEDLDLCRRLRSRNWRLRALPRPWATHLNGSSAPDDWRREFHWWSGTMRFAAQWFSTTAFVGALFAASLQCVQLAVLRPRQARSAVRSLLLGPVSVRRRRPSPWERPE